jgi:hypothetical protein
MWLICCQEIVLDKLFLVVEEDVEYEPFEENDAAMPEADDYTPEAYDKYIVFDCRSETSKHGAPTEGDRYVMGTQARL